MSNKHKHYEMGVAKLADTSLVKFIKLTKEWVETQSEDWNIASEYFLCLPQHNENGQCLHWLNGGDAQMRKLSGGDWQRMMKSDLWAWSKHNNTMSNEWEFRIKPKKKKCWIVWDTAQSIPERESYTSLERAREHFDYPDAQFIEIEVEV